MELSNQEAEENVIGIMLIDPDKIPMIKSLINTNDIWDNKLSIIYKTILDLYNNNKQIDIITVSELLKFNNVLDDIGGRARINDLALHVVSTSNYEHYCKIIANYSRKRNVRGLLLESINALDNGEDVNDLTTSIRCTLDDVIASKDKTSLSHISSKFTDVLEDLETVIKSEDKALGLACQHKTLNRTLSGFVKQRLYILGARPAMGKSSFAMGVARHISKEHNVLFVSLEMPDKEYTQREMFSICNINQDMVSNGSVLTETLCTLTNSLEELSNSNLWILDKSECTIDDIKAKILEMKTKHGGCDFVIIDYLQLMASSDRRVKDIKDIVSSNSTKLKRLARQYDIPILALCQLSRALEGREDKRPILSDLKESGSIEQDADVCMFIYRDEVYNPNTIDRGGAELIIRKNRQGKIRTIPMIFQASATRFTEKGR